VPRSGFINVLDYKTPKDLAAHLVYLNSNRDEYNRYFAWKKYVKFTNRKNALTHQFNKGIFVPPFCDICIALHLENYFGIRKSVIRDTGPTFWSVKTDCQLPSLTII
jgi:hypothetical protein